MSTQATGEQRHPGHRLIPTRLAPTPTQLAPTQLNRATRPTAAA